MHQDHAAFTNGIDGRRRVRLTWFSQEDGMPLIRDCAPMDYGPSRRNLNPNPDRYHFWDYESDEGAHTLSLTDQQVTSIESTDTSFDPADFVTWAPIAWFYPRDWGEFS